MPAPILDSYTQNPASYKNRRAIVPNKPSVSGGVATSFAITPNDINPLPEGLFFDTRTGILSGTPQLNGPLISSDFTVTASNNVGFSSIILSIEVTDTAPAFLYYIDSLTLVRESSFTFTQNVAITPLTATVTGSPTSYTSNPALPSGLILDAASGLIYNTPTSLLGPTVHTITASNAVGSTSTRLIIEVVP